ncbi:MAG: sensor histidine kinase [Bryobacteraceae bacterium]
MQKEERTGNSPVGLVVDPPMSPRKVTWVALVGFTLLVGLVLLAAYLGYRGSVQIQETAQDMIREDVIRSGRGAQLEARIEQQSQELIDQLAGVLGLCFFLAVGAAAMTLWIIRRAFAKLEWQSRELAHVSWHMIDGHEKMARRFSHEMHDELGQSLSGLRRMLTRGNEADFASVRPECIAIVDEVLQSVRKLSQVLRPVILDDFGLDSGLRWLCERFLQRTRIAVEYTSNFSGRLDESLETHLFRIAQEALTNIARHSQATAASVDLHVTPSNVTLTIFDNGHGLLPTATEGKGPSLGMVGMRARARQLDGELLVENRKEGGLRIQVDAPRRPAPSHVEHEDPSLVG